MFMIRVCLVAVSLPARIFALGYVFARWVAARGWMLLGAAALCIALPGLMPMPGGSAHAGIGLEERKLPMKFSWVACQPNCRGWVSAVGIVTADSPRDFDEFALGRQLGGATIVLDSSGGSVNDSIALGRRWRNLGVLTTVGISVQTNTAQVAPASIAPEAHCESMCVFLLLSGKTRYVPETAHVRVHQIWIGDRAGDAKAGTYSADDLMIVERDIGRLAKYTFDMGGAGDLLSLSLNVPSWEDLHELSREELRLTNLVTTDMIAEPGSPNAAVVELTPKPVQDRFVSSAVATETNPQPAKSTKTAEAMRPTSGVRAANIGSGTNTPGRAGPPDRTSRPESPAIARMPDQRGCNGKPLCQPSQPPHEYGPGIRPKDATDKEARTPRSRGRSVVVLYNDIRTHRSLDQDAPVSRPVQQAGIISSHAILGGLHHHYVRV